MTRIALIALLAVSVAAPAIASEPLQVTVSDRRVPAFLLNLGDVEATPQALEVSQSTISRLRTNGQLSPSAAELFARIATENDG